MLLFLHFLVLDILEQLMSFFYIIFKAFHAQIDSGLTNEVTQIFMTLLTK